jgi:hypothetical protein
MSAGVPTSKAGASSIGYAVRLAFAVERGHRDPDEKMQNLSIF